MTTLSRSSLSRFVLPCMTATLVLLAAGIAHAGSIFTVTLTQVGPNVVATGSGTIDLTGLDSFGSAFASPEMYPAHGIMGIGPSGTIDQYTGLSGPFDFGPGFGGFPIATSGDSVFLEDFGLGIDVPQGYVSGTFLSGSATYGPGTPESLGATPGTYTWTWDSGADSYVLIIPGTPTPEPGTLSMLGLGVISVAGFVRRK
jgi:PEP-CTERM motif